MTATPQQEPLYPSRSGAGAQLGKQLYRRIRPPALVLGVTPTGVEVAAHVSKAIGCEFDVIVGAHVRIDELGIIGAVAEDSEAILDAEFQPKFAQVDELNTAIDKARSSVKTERLLFRGQRVLRATEGKNVVVVDGHLTSPWKVLAATQVLQDAKPTRLLVAAAVCTQTVQERIRARRIEFVCPSVVMDPGGHPHPFGDPQDPSAERLRSIVVAREAA